MLDLLVIITQSVRSQAKEKSPRHRRHSQTRLVPNRLSPVSSVEVSIVQRSALTVKILRDGRS